MTTVALHQKSSFDAAVDAVITQVEALYDVEAVLRAAFDSLERDVPAARLLSVALRAVDTIIDDVESVTSLIRKGTRGAA